MRAFSCGGVGAVLSWSGDRGGLFGRGGVGFGRWFSGLGGRALGGEHEHEHGGELVLLAWLGGSLWEVFVLGGKYSLGCRGCALGAGRAQAYGPLIACVGRRASCRASSPERAVRTARGQPPALRPLALGFVRAAWVGGEVTVGAGPWAGSLLLVGAAAEGIEQPVGCRVAGAVRALSGVELGPVSSSDLGSGSDTVSGSGSDSDSDSDSGSGSDSVSGSGIGFGLGLRLGFAFGCRGAGRWALGASGFSTRGDGRCARGAQFLPGRFSRMLRL